MRPQGLRNLTAESEAKGCQENVCLSSEMSLVRRCGLSMTSDHLPTSLSRQHVGTIILHYRRSSISTLNLSSIGYLEVGQNQLAFVPSSSQHLPTIILTSRPARIVYCHQIYIRMLNLARYREVGQNQLVFVRTKH